MLLHQRFNALAFAFAFAETLLHQHFNALTFAFAFAEMLLLAMLLFRTTVHYCIRIHIYFKKML